MTRADELEALAAFVRGVDPLRPGARWSTKATDASVQALAEAINDLLERVESERRENGRRQFADQESERRAVAEELHDQAGQLLTAALLQLDQALSRPGDRTPLEDARRATQGALESVGALSRRLRPLILDDLGLADAIAALSASVGRRHGLRVRRILEPEALAALDRDQQVILFRIVREWLGALVRADARQSPTLELRTDGGGAIVLDLSEESGVAGTLLGDRAVGELAVLLGARLEARDAEPGPVLSLRLPLSSNGAGAPW